MRAGQLRHRIDLQAKTVTKGASGGMVDTWAPVATDVPAKITPLSGNERSAVGAGGQVAVPRTEIELRYRAGITAQMRVLHGSTVYDITHVKDQLERHERLVLTCEAGINRG